MQSVNAMVSQTQFIANSYIEISQDGAGKILYSTTPKEVVGLYTYGLESCSCLIAVGSQGIALIHATRITDIKEIIDCFESVGVIQEWHIIYNDSKQFIYNSKEIANSYVQRLQTKFSKPIEHKTRQGFVSITRNLKINMQSIPQTRYTSSDARDRLDINVLNNYFKVIGDPMYIDLQFDGLNFTVLPSLFKSIEQVDSLKKHPEFIGHPDYDKLHSLYRELYPRYNLNERLIKRINLEDIIRRATANMMKDLNIAQHSDLDEQKSKSTSSLKPPAAPGSSSKSNTTQPTTSSLFKPSVVEKELVQAPSVLQNKYIPSLQKFVASLLKDKSILDDNVSNQITCDLYIDKEDKDFPLLAKINMADPQQLEYLKLKIDNMKIDVKLIITENNEKSFLNLNFKSSLKFEELNQHEHLVHSMPKKQ